MFTERTLPMLVHFQICEGLASVVTSDQAYESFRQFDKLKLAEITTFIKDSVGYPAKTQELRKRAELFGEHCLKQNMGSAPFKFGF